MLKAKRRMLKFPSGFMAHFYAISEQMSPLMAWGFLGPDENLREICLYFKVSGCLFIRRKWQNSDSHFAVFFLFLIIFIEFFLNELFGIFYNSVCDLM